jgi:hypothetical protein
MVPANHEGWSVREYAVEDRTACLALFDSNSPEFFAPDERAEYVAFLDRLPCRYLVMTASQQQVIAAGGYYLTEEPGLGALAWGVVARSWHHRGVGRELLGVRLSHLRAGGALAARVRTSQRTRKFFERSGFHLVRVVESGFAPAIDLVELRLHLHSGERR